MSSEVEPVEVEAPPQRAPETAPVAGPERIAAGLGAASAPTLLRHLARRPPEDRKAGIEDLNERVGNRRVTRMIAADGPTVARVGMDGGMVGYDTPEPVTNGEALAMARHSKEISDIKRVTDFGTATVAERTEFITILIGQGWVGPSDEAALERIWNSFGPGIVDVVSNSSDLWDLCVDRGMDPSSIGALAPLRAKFEADVKAVAKAYMQTNLAFADQQMTRLGVDGKNTGSPTQEMESSLALEETQELAAGAKELLEAKDRMLTLHVGYNPINHPMAGGATTPVDFNPEKRPMSREPGWVQKDMHPTAPHDWKTVKEQWDAANAALAGVTAQNPTVFAALAQGRENVEALATQTPQQAKATAAKVLLELRRNILATIPKLDTGDLDWRDLQPLHQQLFAGRPSPSGTPWNEQLPKSVGQDVIGDHETREFWIGLGLSTAAAALFIVAEVATGGLATAALLGGLTISGGQAVASWENYEDLATAAAGTATEETRLVSQGQVDAARVQAILDTIFAVLDFGQARGIYKGIQAGEALAEAVAKNSAEAVLDEGMKKGGAEAATAIERAIAEMGAEATARRTGKSADELLKLLPANSPMRARIEAARALIEAGAKEGAADAAKLEARTALAAGNAAEETWKGTRPLGELLQDIPAALAGKKISPAFADKLVIEGIESMGAASVLKRMGGWRQASQALTDKSAAASRFMEWRTSVFAELEGYVVNNLKGEVQRTGTATKFSNDIDMSFIGPRAAEVRDAAAAYLARRLGVDNSPAAFDRVMMAGLFTDPRRMHAYDGIPDVLRESIARTQAAKQESLIWNRRLWEATHEGDEALAAHVRAEMKGMGIAEFAYRPLSPGDVSRLSRRVDTLHAELEQAVKAGDAAAQGRLAQEIGDAQALINAAEGGGYFSGGGVRRYVSERPGEKPFPRLPGADNAAGIAAEKVTALIDQLPKLDHSMLQLAGTTEEVVAGIRGIGKYGGRLFEVAGEANAGLAGRFEALAGRCAKLKKAADTGASTMTAAEARALAGDASAMFAELQAKSSEILAQIRAGANMPNVGDAMAAIQNMTIAHTRLLRSSEWTLKHINKLVRALEQGRRLSELDEGQTQPGDQRPSNASYPDQNQSVDPSLQ